VLDQITPLILTLNEAPNIARTLGKLCWARRIVVVDSGSTDGTLELVAGHSQAEVLARPFDDFERQWNFGLEAITSPWILSLDADYELSDELVDELRLLVPARETMGYRAKFVYRIHGRNLTASLYPPRTVLFRNGHAYRQEGHTQQLAIAGQVLPLTGQIFHDDRKPLSRWVASQQRYAREEAAYLLGQSALSRVDRLRRTGWLGPLLVFLYTLFFRRCLFDGWPGWYYALQRCIVEAMIALEIVDRRLRGSVPDDVQAGGNRP
jgi:glycosyltransferase involved in cell wall biosynthesis